MAGRTRKNAGNPVLETPFVSETLYHTEVDPETGAPLNDPFQHEDDELLTGAELADAVRETFDAEPEAVSQETNGADVIIRGRFYALASKILGRPLSGPDEFEAEMFVELMCSLGERVLVLEAEVAQLKTAAPARSNFERKAPSGLVKLAYGQKCNEHQKPAAAHGFCPVCYVNAKKAEAQAKCGGFKTKEQQGS